MSHHLQSTSRNRQFETKFGNNIDSNIQRWVSFWFFESFSNHYENFTCNFVKLHSVCILFFGATILLQFLFKSKKDQKDNLLHHYYHRILLDFLQCLHRLLSMKHSLQGYGTLASVLYYSRNILPACSFSLNLKLSAASSSRI